MKFKNLERSNGLKIYLRRWGGKEKSWICLKEQFHSRWKRGFIQETSLLNSFLTGTYFDQIHVYIERQFSLTNFSEALILNHLLIE